MSIIKLLLQNLREGTVTLPFPERPPIQGEFRGMVQNNPEECTGCGLCAYVCTSSAITVQRVLDGYQWSYDPAKCTFCSRCVSRCPKHSIQMEHERPPVYQEHGSLAYTHQIKKKTKPPAAPATPAASKSEPAGAQ